MSKPTALEIPVAIILDTETTDAGATPQPCEIAWLSLPRIVPGVTLQPIESFVSRFDITCPMSFGAQKIHGITKESLRGLPTYQGTRQLAIPGSVKYMICHNAPFDYTKVLRSPKEFTPICTLALAKKLIKIEPGCSMSPSGKFRSYKLVDLCSDLYPNHRDFIFSGAHGAKFDSGLTLLLLNYILENWEFGSWDELVEFQRS